MIPIPLPKKHSMKIVAKSYKIQRVEAGTIEFELDETQPTCLNGRSGGSSYVAAFIPEWGDEWATNENGETVRTGRRLSGFNVISSTVEREGRMFLSVGFLSDWDTLKRTFVSLPHSEDILNWFTGDGEEYNHIPTSFEEFLTTLQKWRKIN